MVEALMAWLGRIFHWDTAPHTPLEAPKQPQVESLPVTKQTMNPQDNFYQAAKNALGTHRTLDPNVPNELGCAEAWSSIATDAGVTGIPQSGFAGTDAIDTWLSQNPHFKRIDAPEPGATILSPTRGTIHGHVGICAQYDLQYNKDWGIISNDSATGLVREQWSYKSWIEYYTNRLGLPVHLYRYIGG